MRVLENSYAVWSEPWVPRCYMSDAEIYHGAARSRLLLWWRGFPAKLLSWGQCVSHSYSDVTCADVTKRCFHKCRARRFIKATSTQLLTQHTGRVTEPVREHWAPISYDTRFLEERFPLYVECFGCWLSSAEMRGCSTNSKHFVELGSSLLCSQQDRLTLATPSCCYLLLELEVDYMFVIARHWTLTWVR